MTPTDRGSNYDKQMDTAREIFRTYDIEKIAAKFSLETDARYMHITYMNTPYLIEKATGTILEPSCSPCRSFNTVLTIYDMLCHNEDDVLPALSGSWVPVESFSVTGKAPDPGVFSQKYADRFSGHIKALRSACVSLGGEILPPIAGADISARIPAFTFFPVILQFWEGDDEFAPKVKILWDARTMSFLRFETTYYLQGDLLGRLCGSLCTNAE